MITSTVLSTALLASIGLLWLGLADTKAEAYLKEPDSAPVVVSQKTPEEIRETNSPEDSVVIVTENVPVLGVVNDSPTPDTEDGGEVSESEIPSQGEAGEALEIEGSSISEGVEDVLTTPVAVSKEVSYDEAATEVLSEDDMETSSEGDTFSSSDDLEAEGSEDNTIETGDISEDVSGDSLDDTTSHNAEEEVLEETQDDEIVLEEPEVEEVDLDVETSEESASSDDLEEEVPSEEDVYVTIKDVVSEGALWSDSEWISRGFYKAKSGKWCYTYKDGEKDVYLSALYDLTEEELDFLKTYVDLTLMGLYFNPRTH